LYSRAAALKPADRMYGAYRDALQARATLTAENSAASATSASRIFDSTQLVQIGELSPSQMEEIREALPPPQLKKSTERQSFHLSGEAQTIFEQVCAAYGIKVTFEGGYQAPPPFRFEVNDLTVAEALRTLEAVSNSFLIPLSESSIMV